MEDTQAMAEEANAPAKRGPKRNILKTKTGFDRKGSEHNGSDKEVHAECLEPFTYSMASFSLAKSLEIWALLQLAFPVPSRDFQNRFREQRLCTSTPLGWHAHRAQSAVKCGC